MLFIQYKKNVVLVLGVLFSLFFAIVALLIPFEDVVVVASHSFSLTNQVNIANLQIQLTNENRPILVLLFVYLAFLFSGSFAARTHKNFIPLSLIVNAFVMAGISVKPILFGILFIQPAIFISVFLLMPPESRPIKGVLRFLVFQVMGMVFLLLAGWSISGGSEIIEDSELLQRGLLFFWIGLSFLFAVFPLYTWVIMLTEKVHPYVVIFIFASFFGGYSFILLSMIENYFWFFDWENMREILQIAGFLLAITGGIGAFIQMNLGRLFGFAVLIEVGYSLFAIASGDLNLFYGMMLPRVFALSVWALGLSIFYTYSKDLSFESVNGLGRKFPFACSAVILAQFSLSGVPLLAGFPLLLTLWKQISSYSYILASWTFMGSMGLLFGSLRSFSCLMTGPDEVDRQEQEDKVQVFYLVAGLIILFLLGIFPHWVDLFFSRIIEGVEMLNL